MDMSEAAIRASGSLGNEVAIPHLYQIIETGKKSQRIAAVQALAAIRAPSSAGMLIKYFNHFPARTSCARRSCGRINTISPTSPQAQELNQAVYLDPHQSEAVKRIAVEALVEAEKHALLLESLPEGRPRVQEAAFMRMLQSGSQEVPDFTRGGAGPAALGCYLCLYTLKADSQRSQNAGQAQRPAELGARKPAEGPAPDRRCLPARPPEFQGRLRYPTRVFRLLLLIPSWTSETEGLVGDFLKRIVDGGEEGLAAAAHRVLRHRLEPAGHGVRPDPQERTSPCRGSPTRKSC